MPPPKPTQSRRAPRHRRLLRAATVAVGGLLVVLTAGCADFSSEASTFTVQPTLTAKAAVPETSQPPASQSPPPSGSAGADPSGSVPPPDPCAPTDAAVIATCLSAPWGLAPLPDGESALVGERTTGRILQVAAGKEPALVAQIDGVDSSGDGGLLGIALSPSYDEDGLIYVYVTTAEGQSDRADRPRRHPEGDFHRHPEGRRAQRRPDRVRPGPGALRRHR